MASTDYSILLWLNTRQFYLSHPQVNGSTCIYIKYNYLRVSTILTGDRINSGIDNDLATLTNTLLLTKYSWRLLLLRENNSLYSERETASGLN